MNLKYFDFPNPSKCIEKIMKITVKIKSLERIVKLKFQLKT